MSDAGSIIVRVTATDTGLKAVLAADKAEISAFARDGSVEFRNLAQNIDQSLGLVDRQLKSARASASVFATSFKTAALETTAAVEKIEPAAVGAAAGVEKVASAASRSHGSISTATREFRALFDELSSGRTRMTPGTLAIIGQRVFGLSLGALAAAGAVVGLVAAIGYLIVKAIDADNALQRLKIDMDFEGLDVSKAQLKSFADEIGKDGEEILSGMAKVADSATELQALSLATKQYAEVSGEKAPAAIKTMTEAMASEHLTLAELHAMFPGVTQQQRENFLAIQQMGDGHKTAAALVSLVDAEINKARGDLITYNAGWTSVGNDVRLASAYFEEFTGHLIPLSGAIEGGIKLWDRFGASITSATTAMRNYLGIVPAVTQVDIVRANLVAEQTKKIDGQTAAMDKGARTTAATAQANQAIIASAMQAGEAFDTEGRRATELAAKVEQMKKALATPGITKNETATITKEKADAERQLAEISKRSQTEVYENFVAKQDAMADAAKAGSAARIAADQAEVEKAAQLFGSESTEYYRAVAKLNEAKREGATTGASEFRKGGEEEIAAVKEKISEINADETKGGAERVALINEQYQQLLASTKLTGAQRVNIEKEYNDELAAEHKQAAEQLRATDQNTAQTDLAIAKIGFQEKRDQLNAEVSAYRMTKAQELAALLTLAQAEGDAEQATLTKAEAGYSADSTFFIEKENEKRLAAAQTKQEIERINAEIAADNRKTAQADAQGWHMAIDEITNAEGQFINSALSGRQSFMQSVYQMTSSFIKKELADDLAYYTKKMLLSREAFAADAAHEQGGILVHLLGETQKTAATVTGSATRLAAQETATTTAAATEATVGSSQIMNDAYKAAAGAYSAVAGIPYVGPFLAPAAAATAFVAVAAFDTLTSLDVGAWNVPKDMPAMIHKGESVVPTKFAEGMRSGGGFGGGGSTTNNINLNHSPTINAPQQEPFGQMLDRNASQMRAWFHAQLRSGAIKLGG